MTEPTSAPAAAAPKKVKRKYSGWGQRPRCLVDGCNALASSHGMCNAHYQRKLRHGDPLGGGPSKPRRDAKLQPPMSTPNPAPVKKGPENWTENKRRIRKQCDVPGCEVLARKNGKCARHAAENANIPDKLILAFEGDADKEIYRRLSDAAAAERRSPAAQAIVILEHHFEGR